MVTFLNRPDTIFLLNNGCSPSQAFAIIERNRTPICGGVNFSGNSLYQAAVSQTNAIIESEQPPPPPPPPPPPVVQPPPPPPPVIEPLPEPIPDRRLTAKQKRVQRSRARSAQRRSKPIPSDVPAGIKSEFVQAGMGFDGIVDKPTKFLVGESGRERVSVSPIPDFAMDDIFRPIRSGTKTRRKDVFTRNTSIFGMGTTEKRTNIFDMASKKKSSNIFDIGSIPKGIDSTLAFPSTLRGPPGRSKKRSNNNIMGFDF